MPFFRDSQGNLCAMAYPIDRSGRGDLVDRVARTRNNAFVAELANDPELRVWLDSVGLTVAEAARIQPEYRPSVPDKVSDGYALTSILVSGASLTTLGLNLFDPSKATGWAGLLAGGAAVLAGAAKLDDNDATQNVAAANLIIGAGSMVAGLFRVLPRTQRSVSGPSESASGPARLALQPQVIPTPSGTRNGAACRSTRAATIAHRYAGWRTGPTWT